VDVASKGSFSLCWFAEYCARVGDVYAHSGGSRESGGGERTRTFLVTLELWSIAEASACWKLVGGGGVDAVSNESRAGKRAAADDVVFDKVAVSTVKAALLRNGLDDAMVNSLRGA
jgi:hypothetical protein